MDLAFCWSVRYLFDTSVTILTAELRGSSEIWDELWNLGRTMTTPLELKMTFGLSDGWLAGMLRTSPFQAISDVMSFLNEPSSASFIVYFRSFLNKQYKILLQINVKRCQPRIWCQDSNSRPSDYESSPLTTGSGIPSFLLLRPNTTLGFTQLIIVQIATMNSKKPN